MISSQKINNKPSAVTGLSCISCLGDQKEDLWLAALEGRSGIIDGKGSISDSIHGKCCEYLKQQPQFQSQPQEIKDLVFAEKSLVWTLAAILRSMNEAGWESLNEDDGFILATTTGSVALWEDKVMDYFKGDNKSNENIYVPLSKNLLLIRKILNHKGPFLLLTSACSASTQAFGMAHLWLRKKRVKRCLVGGVEQLCRLTLSGFGAFQLLSEKTSLPFDERRSGINLSEGASFVCLENDVTSEYGYVAGCGFSSDANHMTAPAPDGRGSKESMLKALRSANIQPQDIHWIHAHGTGSIHNDNAESNAICSLEFSPELKVSSTKYLHGHALAASGAIESVLCLMAMKEQTYIPNWGFKKASDGIDAPLLNQVIKKPLNYILKNTLGFGGVNASIVFSKEARL